MKPPFDRAHGYTQRAAVAQALEAIEGVPYDLRQTAFKEVLRSILGGSQPAAPSYESGYGSDEAPDIAGLPHSSAASPVVNETSDQDIYQVVSEATNIRPEYLELVFYMEKGEVEVAARKDQLGDSRAESVRAVAQILATVHQVGLREDGVRLENVREACRARHCYDDRHFSRDLRALTGFVLKGEGKEARLEAGSIGIAAFPALVSSIVGESVEIVSVS